MSQTKAQLIDNLVQPITGALGSASAPTFSFTADPNTGLYSPGADQLALTTGGTGRLFIDASGRVGINTSSPTEILTVSKAEFANAFPFHIQNTQNWGWGVGLKLRQILASGGSVTDSAAIVSDWDGDNNSTLEFYTVTSSSLTEKLRITSTGRVGIGTSAPQVLTHLSTSTDTQLRVESTSASGTNEAAIQLIRGSNQSAIKNKAGGIEFFVQGLTNEIARFDSSGRLGIGTTTPTDTNSYGTAVDIRGSSTGNGGVIYLRNSDATVTGQLAVYGDGRMDLGTTTNHPLRFFTFNSERARIDSSGKLLVGTSTARSWAGVNSNLQVEGTTWDNSSASFTRNSADSVGGALALGKSRGTALGSHTVVQSGDFLGRIHFVGADGSALIQGASITGEVDGTPGSNDMPGRLVFSTTADGASSPTERMRIRNGGDTGIFCDANNDVLYLSATAAAGTSRYLLIGKHSATGTITSGTISLLIFTNGNIQNTNNSYAGISDIKLKENVVDAASQWDDIKALQVRKYNFKEGQTHTQIGLIAQEVELVSPGLVTKSPDRDAEGNDLGTVTKSVNYSVLYMKAVKALQEAMERIEQLEAKVAALESV